MRKTTRYDKIMLSFAKVLAQKRAKELESKSSLNELERSELVFSRGLIQWTDKRIK